MDLGQNQVEALDLWRRVTVTTVRSDAPDLTARQMAVLMTVCLHRQFVIRFEVNAGKIAGLGSTVINSPVSIHLPRPIENVPR